MTPISSAEGTTPPPLLELVAVTKRYPGVTALDSVSFELRPGEVHALVGENGAGKSTIVNMLCGLARPDSGEIRLEGRPIRIPNPVAAREMGVVVVHQETDVFEPVSIAESMALAGGLPSFLGLVRWRKVASDARAAASAMEEPIDVRSLAGSVGTARRQLLAVGAAAVRKARVVLLDEPTSSLSNRESGRLFELIAEMKANGVGILYISHRPEEIARLADRVTVLRDGKVVATELASATDRGRLIRMMVGREELPVDRAPGASLDGRPPALRVKDMSDRGGRFRGISLEVAPGEVLGIYGLVGAGRTEWARAVHGSRPGASGTVEIHGRPAVIRSPVEAIRLGVAYLPEDRLREGILPGLSIRSNLVIGSLERWGIGPFAVASIERRAAREPMSATGVKARSVEQPIRELSGGNQQKVVFGRSLLARPKVLILDEPTRGVDLGAKAEIHRLVRKLAADGAGIVMISSDLPEVLSQSDRIVVFREGEIAGTFRADRADAETVASAALPVGPATDAPKSESARRGLRGEWGLPFAVVVLAAALALTTGGRFATSANLLGLVSNASVLTILALGSAAVMIAGGIDISVGSLTALAAACGALTMSRTASTPAGIAVGLGVGMLGGLFNAATSIVGRIHPVVVTLGMMTVYRGVLLVLTGGDVLGNLPEDFRLIANGRLAGIPGSVPILAAAALPTAFFLGYVKAGRQLRAFGANPRAARAAGISKARAWGTAFGIGGLAAGLAGLLELAQNGSMQSMMGQGYELKAIAAAVVGGVAVSGGRGEVRGVVLGGLLLALIQNALILWAVSRYRYDLVIGGLLLTAVLLDRWTRRGEA